MQTYQYDGPDGPVQIPLTDAELRERFPWKDIKESVAAYLASLEPNRPDVAIPRFASEKPPKQ